MPARRLLLAALALAAACTATPAPAISPQNPYRSFNLSGINYGSMQWERDRRQGRSFRPAATPQTARGGTVTAGEFVGTGGGGAVVREGRSRPVPRAYRRVRPRP